MKLKRLEIENFLKIGRADMNLSCPVNLILGENAAGKSSVLHALAYPLLRTCEQRGYVYKKDGPQLAGGHGDGFKITLETDGGTYAATATTGTKSPMDAAVASVILDPQRVLNMTAKHRQAVFGILLRHGGSADKVEEWLSKNNGWTPEVYEQCRQGLDEAQAWAIEQRRAAKRRLEELAQTKRQGPADVIEESGRTVDLAKLKGDELAGKLSQRQGELNTLEAELAQYPPEGPAPVDAVGEALRTLQAERKKIKMADAQKKVDQAGVGEQALVERLAQLEQKVQTIQSKECLTQQERQKWVDLRDVTDGSCPHCGQAITAEMAGKQIERLDAELQRLEKDAQLHAQSIKSSRTKLAKIEAAVDKARQENESVLERAQKLDVEVARCQEHIQQAARWPLCQKETEAVRAKVAALGRIQTAFAAYHGWTDAKKELDRQMTEAQNTIDMMDRLDKALKPDGALRTVANAEVSGLAFDRELAGAWGLDSLQLEPDGTIRLHGRPVEAASASEQYRVSVLLAELLARTAGEGMLVLDGLELLSRANRRILWRRLPAWLGTGAGKLHSIVLAMTADGGNRTPQTNWCRCWWVEDGSVRVIEGQQQEAAQVE